MPVPDSVKANRELGVAIDKSLDSLGERLAALETNRRKELEDIQSRFAKMTDALSAPAEAELQLRTRRDVLDVLETLREALGDGDVEKQRRLVRSILVANETRLHDIVLADLGELYLDTLAQSRMLNVRLEKREFENLWRIMRRAAKDEGRIPTLLRDYRVYLAAETFSITSFVFSGILASDHALNYSKFSRSDWWLPLPFDFVTLIPYGCLFLAAAIGTAWWTMNLAGSARRRNYMKQTRNLRGMLGELSDDERIDASYPQAH